MLRPIAVLLSSILLVWSFSAASSHAQWGADSMWAASPKAQVLLLGTFHFKDPGLDSYKPQYDIDIFSAERQAEIETLAENIARQYRPTRVAVEVRADRQPRLDSLYRAYRAERHTLSASEVQQLGFRIAEAVGHDRLWAIDVQGRSYTPDMTQDEWEAEVARRPATDTTWDYRYTQWYQYRDSLKTTMPLPAYLALLNSEKWLWRGHGHYVVGGFATSDGPDDYFGVDQATAWWNRNLRIFRNIQRITTSSDERILVIIGAGHVPLIRHSVEASPAYELIDAQAYLK